MLRAPELKALPESYYETLKSGRGRVILAASRSDEYSWVLPGASNSLFTQHLLAGLRGGAPGPGGVIRIFDLFDYVQRRVVADRSDQHPLFKAELEENFPVALYLGGKAPVLPQPVPAERRFRLRRLCQLPPARTGQELGAKGPGTQAGGGGDQGMH